MRHATDPGVPGETTFRLLEARDAERSTSALCDLLIDCVDGGASVGFMSPLERVRAERFWRSVFEAVRSSARYLFVAERGDEIVGTVQLIVDFPENQPHRAEIAKMLVRRDARRLGIGRELMSRAERVAAELDKTLLVLDTANPSAERLYLSLGWRRAGVIPNFALMPDGSMTQTTFLYRDLDNWST